MPASITDKTLKRKAEVSRALQRLCGNKLQIEYSPASSYSNDPESSGHLFTVTTHTDPEFDWLWACSMDDRRELAPQLVAWLRKVAKWFDKVADRVEAGRVGAA